jgi:4-amino-4-deoxy-L-arabinose transferase-like glycosyltransferase
MTPSNIKTMLIFVGLGPPIGFLVFLFIISLFALQAKHITEVVSNALDFMALGMMVSYVVGIVPAAIAGAVIIWVRTKALKREIWCIFGLSVLIGAIYTLVWPGIISFIFRIHSVEKTDAYSFVVLISTCLFPTLCCWFLSRKLDKPVEIGSL